MGGLERNRSPVTGPATGLITVGVKLIRKIFPMPVPGVPSRPVNRNMGDPLGVAVAATDIFGHKPVIVCSMATGAIGCLTGLHFIDKCGGMDRIGAFSCPIGIIMVAISAGLFAQSFRSIAVAIGTLRNHLLAITRG